MHGPTAGTFHFTTPLALTVASFVAVAPAWADPRAVPLETVQDVGRIDDHQDVDVAYTIANQGDSELQLVDLVASCGCTVADYDEVIAPGEEGTVRVTLKPQGYTGPLARSVRVYTNDAGNPYIELVVKAVIAPSVYMTPGYARLVGLAGEEIEPSSQVLWAADLADFRVTSATTELPFVEVGVRPASPEEQAADGSGNQWVVEVRLAEDVPDDTFSDVIRIETNHPRRPEIELPIFGQVHWPVRSVPSRLELGMHSEGDEIEASVRLATLDEDLQVEYGEATLPPDAPGEIEAQLENEDEATYLVVVFRNWPPGPIETEIHVPTSHPEVPVLKIPVGGVVTDR